MNIALISRTLCWALTEPVFSLMTEPERAAVDAAFHPNASQPTIEEAARCIVAFATAVERLRSMTGAEFSAAYGVHPLEGEPLRERVLQLYALCLREASMEEVMGARKAA